MKFLPTAIPLMIAGYISASPAIAAEKKCHEQVPFCEPMTVYEEGKEYASEAVEFGDPDAYKKIVAQQRGDLVYKNDGDIAYILVKPVNITRSRKNLPESTTEDVPALKLKLNPKTRTILGKGNYHLEATVEGELCGEDKGFLGMQVYANESSRLFVIYDFRGKEIDTTSTENSEKVLEDICNYQSTRKQVK